MLKKNNKGFTLIELLATIVILGIIAGITIPLVSNYYTKGREKANEAFKEQIVNYVKDYIALYGSNLGYGNGVQNQKCYIDTNTNATTCDTVTLYKANTNLNIKSIENDLVNKKIINPSSEIECTNSNIKISIYRDTDYVYCMKISPNGESCIDEVINTCKGLFKNEVQ